MLIEVGHTITRQLPAMISQYIYSLHNLYCIVSLLITCMARSCMQPGRFTIFNFIARSVELSSIANLRFFRNYFTNGFCVIIPKYKIFRF
jgi:hypothetical protein